MGGLFLVISVVKLTKTYVSKDKKSVTALKNISFNLPDKGLVFITGKSGSGKSTLLNMLGGLDNITKGDIIADGNRFSTFKPNDYDRYRNSYLGFIFQDYCLLEDLTIYQNLELVIDLNKQNDKSQIKTLIDKVHLTNCENRYPKELSGGQKQRVAIARALAKDPQMILADEPTGNLDSKTAKQIMNLLKDLSKTKLVVVVSHNLEDAENFGDRIIELSDGEIIRDEEKMIGFENKLENINGKLILPRQLEYSEDEIKQMSNWAKAGEVQDISQRECGFYPSDNEQIKTTKVFKTTPSKLSWKNCLSLSWKFLKKRRLGFILTSIIVSCIFVILGICQFFVQFDYNKAINDAVASESQSVLVGYKGQVINDNTLISSSIVYNIPDEDVDSFHSDGYSSQIYRLYNDSIPVSGASQLLRQEIRINNEINLSNFYLLESYGTLVCEEEYLKRIFGVNGELKYIGKLTDKEYGIIITDYMADALINYRPQHYSSREDVLGQIFIDDTHYITYVNAIIDTDYENTYSSFKDELMLEYATKISQGKSSYITDSSKFTKFAEDISNYLGVAYSLNADYDSAILDKASRNYTRVDFSYISSSKLQSKFYISDVMGYVASDNDIYNTLLASGNICMNASLYNNIFGTTYTTSNLSTFQPITITLDKTYKYASDDCSPILSKEFTITKLIDTSSDIILFSDSDFAQMRDTENYCYSLYFSDTSIANKIYGTAEENNIYISSDAYNSVKTIIDVVEIFTDFFVILTIGLCLACVLLLVNFSAGNIRRRKYEIGVIKAMGGQTKEVGKIFILQVLFIGLIVCAISTISLLLMSSFVNSVLLNAMLFFVDNPTLGVISIVKFNPLVMFIDVIIMLAITFLSSLIPLIKLHRIKPVNIIKHKN